MATSNLPPVPGVPELFQKDETIVGRRFSRLLVRVNVLLIEIIVPSVVRVMNMVILKGVSSKVCRRFGGSPGGQVDV